MLIKKTILAGALLLAGVAGIKLFAHCQIPCGIYDDPARLTLLAEHVTTIEKSMNQILELSGDQKSNWNQIVRWVKNKETHADELTHIVTYYFMAQRIKPKKADDEAAYGKYVKELTLLHHMVVHAMKAKQTVDLTHVNELRVLLKEFTNSYLGK